MRQSEKRNARNRIQRATIRTAVKKVRSAETTEAAAQALVSAEKLLDRAAGKNLLHENAAARLKSRLNTLAKKK